MTFQTYRGEIPVPDMLTDEQRETFLSNIETVSIPAETELWRFTSKQSDKSFGAYWVDPSTMKTIMRALHTTNGDFSQNYKKYHIRNNLAVLNQFSKINWRIKITLQKDIIAHVGRIKTQKDMNWDQSTYPLMNTPAVRQQVETRIGNQIQYVIPRFGPVSDINDYARIELKVHI